jgi:hypothetical protein
VYLDTTFYKCTGNDVGVYISLINKFISMKYPFAFILYFFKKLYLMVRSGFRLCFNVNLRFTLLFISSLSFSARLCLFIYFLTSCLIENLVIVVMRRNFKLRTQSLVVLDSEVLYKGQMHGKRLGRNK